MFTKGVFNIEVSQTSQSTAATHDQIGQIGLLMEVILSDLRLTCYIYSLVKYGSPSHACFVYACLSLSQYQSRNKMCRAVKRDE
jgi:hypothetical protein